MTEMWLDFHNFDWLLHANLVHAISKMQILSFGNIILIDVNQNKKGAIASISTFYFDPVHIHRGGSGW